MRVRIDAAGGGSTTNGPLARRPFSDEISRPASPAWSRKPAFANRAWTGGVNRYPRKASAASRCIESTHGALRTAYGWSAMSVPSLG